MTAEKSLLHLYPNLSWDQSKDMVANLDFFRQSVEECRDFLRQSKAGLENYVQYCAKRKLDTDTNALTLVGTLYGVYGQALEQLEHDVDDLDLKNVRDHVLQRRQVESSLRSLHQLRMPIARAAAWVSEAYDQSTYAQMFNSVTSGYEIKYDRYESMRLSKIEADIEKLVRLGEGASVLATSSGMAAYQMLDTYLRNAVLQPYDTVLIAHALYSEVSEGMLKGFSGNVIKDEVYDSTAIVDRIVETGARVVYLDPMKNRLNMRLCDVDDVIRQLKERGPERPVTLVVDGTMTTGSDDFFDHVVGSNIEILYYSSCCKYMQLGQDCVSAGFAAFPQKLMAEMKDIRRYTGTILYDTDGWVYPDVTESQYFPRMERMMRNALLIGDAINNAPELRDFVEAIYPGLPSHEDFAISSKYRSLGSLITFRFKAGEPSHDDLNVFVDGFIKHAKTCDIEVVNGESFGFSVPRIYVGWTPTKIFPPFLRLSAGDRTLDEVKKFADYFRDELAALKAERVPAAAPLINPGKYPDYSP